MTILNYKFAFFVSDMQNAQTYVCLSFLMSHHATYRNGGRVMNTDADERLQHWTRHRLRWKNAIVRLLDLETYLGNFMHVNVRVAAAEVEAAKAEAEEERQAAENAAESLAAATALPPAS